MRKLKILPRSNNGVSRTHSGFSLYQYQKNELIRRAAHEGCSVSYYMNKLLWNDWLMEQEKRRK